MSRPGDQRAWRARVAKAGVWGLLCPRCGQPILPGQEWDLDHVDQLWADGGGGRRLPAHSYCNRAHGARVGNHRRGEQRRLDKLMATQEITVWAAASVQIDQARQNTWLATAARDDAGVTVVKLWPPLPGTDVAAAITAMLEEWGTDRLAINPRSPSATLMQPLEAAGVRLQMADGVGRATAHGLFSDLLNSGRLAIIGRPELDAAARLAEQRRLAGSVALDAYQGGVEPLLSVQLAVWALEASKEDMLPENNVW
jgi:hypothetical protein